MSARIPQSLVDAVRAENAALLMPTPPVMLTFAYGDSRPRIPSGFWASDGTHPKKFTRWFVLGMTHPYGDPAAPHVLYDVFGVGERGQPIGPLYRVRVRYQRDWWEAHAPR